jgi:hypothetical protein
VTSSQPPSSAPAGGGSHVPTKPAAHNPGTSAPKPSHVVSVPSTGGAGGVAHAPSLPKIPLPPVVPPVSADQLGGQVTQTVDQGGQAVTDTVDGVTDTVDDVTDGVTGGLPKLGG